MKQNRSSISKKSSAGDGRAIKMKHVEEVAKEYNLSKPKIEETLFSPEEGYLITLEDAFGEKVVLTIDVNGIRRRTKHLK